ncbi:hypothetical protein MYA_5932 [Burkholderia sp. KJ006]|nr:hypothetical protein MYA_5932 [Burkholderia sp. KJ006]
MPRRIGSGFALLMSIRQRESFAMLPNDRFLGACIAHHHADLAYVTA